MVFVASVAENVVLNEYQYGAADVPVFGGANTVYVTQPNVKVEAPGAVNETT